MILFLDALKSYNRHNKLKTMKLILTLFILFITTTQTLSFETKARQAILMDFETGEILYKKNEKERVFPSSMTKIMTAYLIFEKLNNNELNLSNKIKISENAWKQIGSRTFLNIGSNVPIEELLMGLIVQSGNDCAYALAEGISGNIENFVKSMNSKAKKLGLKNTNYTNPIGFSEEGHYMSVEDTAILSKNLILSFPKYYTRYFSMPEYKYNNISQANRNSLLKDYPGIDGIKTGHTEAGGYALASSIFKDNRRLIAIVNGTESEKERCDESIKLFDYGFNNLKRYTMYEKNEIITKSPILFGKQKNINVIVREDILATSNDKKNISVQIKLNEKIKAPIKENDNVGSLVIKTNTDERHFDLYSADSVREVNIFKKAWLKIYYFFLDLLER